MQKKTTSFVLLLMLFLTSGLIIKAEDQGWINNEIKFNVNEKWDLAFSNEGRFNEITYQNPYLKNWQAGVLYSLPKNFYLGLRYKRETSDEVLFVLSENRVTLETGWKKRLGERLNFDLRFRTEIRDFEKELSDDHLRFRFRVRLTTSLKIGNLHLKPFIATEPFGDTLSDEIFRNRFYLGTSFVLSEKVDLIINYIRQDTKDKETVHILNTGFDIEI
ncbi:MAG: DUF2490 domain-containing protein [Candidatus Aminicenantes bacterium]|nr:DUF2490 domain-containing protein [Candidatus Aminicenantes bacterium]